MDENRETLLGVYRALDLTEAGCMLCGKLFADFGADVIKIEPPGGSPSRRIGPFYKDIPHPEKSLFWFAYNTSKRGVTLDIETADGREIIKKLAKTADFLFESYPPGYMDSLGLGYSELSRVNPGIIMTSITPYGQSGPKAHYRSCELTTWASGVILWITGEPDRPPVWISFPQASLNGGAQGATAAMIALWHRAFTGEGQHIDVSMQQALVRATTSSPIWWDLNRHDVHRTGTGVVVPPRHNLVHTGLPGRDGFVAVSILGGGNPTYVGNTRRLVQWMDEEGQAPEWLKSFDWVHDYDPTRCTQETISRVEAEWVKFFMTKSKSELLEGAIARKVFVAPANNTRDLWESPQLRARGFWEEVEHPELNDRLSYCGEPLKVSETPARISRRPPLIGEHNEEVYVGELGFSREQLIMLKQANIV